MNIDAPGYTEIPNIIRRSGPLSDERRHSDPAYGHYTALLRSGMQLLHDERMDLAGIDCAYGGGHIRTELLQQLNITSVELPLQPLFWIAYYRTKGTLEALIPDEKVKYEINKKKESIRRLKLINEEISRSGVTYPLTQAQVEMIADIQLEIGSFRTVRFGPSSRIFCDMETYLKIVMRYLPALRAAPAEFPYKSAELSDLIARVLHAVEDGLSEHHRKNAGGPFSRRDPDAVPYNGARYSFDIDGDGKLILFSDE